MKPRKEAAPRKLNRDEEESRKKAGDEDDKVLKVAVVGEPNVDTGFLINKFDTDLVFRGGYGGYKEEIQGQKNSGHVERSLLLGNGHVTKLQAWKSKQEDLNPSFQAVVVVIDLASNDKDKLIDARKNIKKIREKAPNAIISIVGTNSNSTESQSLNDFVRGRHLAGPFIIHTSAHSVDEMFCSLATIIEEEQEQIAEYQAKIILDEIKQDIATTDFKVSGRFGGVVITLDDKKKIRVPTHVGEQWNLIKHAEALVISKGGKKGTLPPNQDALEKIIRSSEQALANRSRNRDKHDENKTTNTYYEKTYERHSKYEEIQKLALRLQEPERVRGRAATPGVSPVHTPAASRSPSPVRSPVPPRPISQVPPRPGSQAPHRPLRPLTRSVTPPSREPSPRHGSPEARHESPKRIERPVLPILSLRPVKLDPAATQATKITTTTTKTTVTPQSESPHESPRGSRDTTPRNREDYRNLFRRKSTQDVEMGPIGRTSPERKKEKEATKEKVATVAPQTNIKDKKDKHTSQQSQGVLFPPRDKKSERDEVEMKSLKNKTDGPPSPRK